MSLVHKFFPLLILLTLGCNEKGKDHEDKKSTKKSLASIFRKDIDTEYSDSLKVEEFLFRNPDFQAYRKKMHKFYSRRNYRLAWSEEGYFLPQAEMFINLVHDINSHGVKPYKADSLRKIYKETTEVRYIDSEEGCEMRKSLDLLLSASYFKYSQEIWRGTVDPENKNIQWYIDRKKIKYGKTLDAILDQSKSKNPFLELEPLHPEYLQLKSLLAEYKKLREKGGWPILNLGSTKKIQKGDTSQIVFLLKKRLFISKDLPSFSRDSIFNIKLEEAVKKFQRRHGLEDDGIVANKTLQVLNVSVEERIEQIIVNMERWRWVPKKINDNYIMVNIPEYKLHIWEDGKEVASMNVIVGQAATRTPIFNDAIEYIVTSPSWGVPHSIVINEIIPMIQKDSTSLSRQNMEVLKNNQPIDPDTINWDSLSNSDIRQYRFRQQPGPGNALGKVKFILPNDFDVYLHDTPAGHLFSQAERDFSHGCIRIEDPLKFAEYLLKDDTSWTKEKIQEAMNRGTEQYIRLKKKEPVYIVYFTSWLDKKGQANFREDLYQHDQKLAKAFFER